MKCSNQGNYKVLVRGNVVCFDTGTGLNSASIEVCSENLNTKEIFFTSCYGFFSFELSNSESYKLKIELDGFIAKQTKIPVGIHSIYMRMQLKTKCKSVLN